MMTNKEIANAFQYLGDLMELHGENDFKIRTYRNAYITLRKLTEPLETMPDEKMAEIKGVGPAVSSKIKELLQTGKMDAITQFQSKTPPGVCEMLEIAGFGPKKVQVIWKQMGVETIGELLYACNENRLVEVKGFGEKTQEDLRQKLQYYQKSQGKFLYADLEKEAAELLLALQAVLPEATVSIAGELRRKATIVEKIEFVIAGADNLEVVFEKNILNKTNEEKQTVYAKSFQNTPVALHTCEPIEFGSKLFRFSAAEPFMSAFLQRNKAMDFKGLPEERTVFTKAALPWLEPELRESPWALENAFSLSQLSLINTGEIRGIVHAHSTYSDGLHSLREMATAAKNAGFEYLGITDHSKSAFYANGLKEDRLQAQWAEVEALNKELAPFRIYKGIESDILADGALDYPKDILKQFDFIIASVHSNLRMDEEKATRRLIGAIENPYTTILGHPTGRLLLSRPGYPLDWEKILDACAANGVCIELNANPHRLDLDWTLIPRALEKGILISINPDAHSIGGMEDIRYGIAAARKGGLTAKHCLSAFQQPDFQAFISKKRA
jgi:DNA polymerase (family 10)